MITKYQSIKDEKEQKKVVNLLIYDLIFISLLNNYRFQSKASLHLLSCPFLLINQLFILLYKRNKKMNITN